VANEFEARVSLERQNILMSASEKIVDANYVRPPFYQPFTQVGPQETCAAGNYNSIL
jgi:hypothetical protein